jgi:hypothetical protein
MFSLFHKLITWQKFQLICPKELKAFLRKISEECHGACKFLMGYCTSLFTELFRNLSSKGTLKFLSFILLSVIYDTLKSS